MGGQLTLKVHITVHSRGEQLSERDVTMTESLRDVKNVALNCGGAMEYYVYHAALDALAELKRREA